jgi:peptidoglycan hydrolase CwlO-like protein
MSGVGNPRPEESETVMNERKSTNYWKQSKVPAGVKAVLTRWWWPVIILLGVVCGRAYVSPYVADTENAINHIIKFKSDRLQELQAEYITADNELFAVEQVIDTLFVPEVEWHENVLDSLRAVRSEIESSFPLLEGQIENLSGQLLALQQPMEETQLGVEQRRGEITQYQASMVALKDSLKVLAREQEALDDRLDRLQNPDKYDRTRALISPGR